MRWNDYYLVTEIGINNYGLLHIHTTVQENLFTWGMNRTNGSINF